MHPSTRTLLGSSLKSPKVPPDTKVHRSLFLPEWGGGGNLPISSVWDERDGGATPVVGEFCCRSPSFCSYLAIRFNGFWEEGSLAQITRADQGPSDWSIVFFHLSIKDEARVCPPPSWPWSTDRNLEWLTCSVSVASPWLLFSLPCQFRSPSFFPLVCFVGLGVARTPERTLADIQY